MNNTGYRVESMTIEPPSLCALCASVFSILESFFHKEPTTDFTPNGGRRVYLLDPLIFHEKQMFIPCDRRTRMVL